MEEKIGKNDQRDRMYSSAVGGEQTVSINEK